MSLAGVPQSLSAATDNANEWLISHKRQNIVYLIHIIIYDHTEFLE